MSVNPRFQTVLKMEATKTDIFSAKQKNAQDRETVRKSKTGR
jgi:hypothetical protein